MIRMSLFVCIQAISKIWN